MNQNALFSEESKKICEVVNCFAPAVREIKVKEDKKAQYVFTSVRDVNLNLRKVKPNEYILRPTTTGQTQGLKIKSRTTFYDKRTYSEIVSGPKRGKSKNNP